MRKHPLLLLAVAALAGFLPRATAQFVGLGTAASYAVLAGTSVTNTGLTVIRGDLGVNPGATVTGFGAGAGTVIGSIHASDAAAAQAKADLSTAYDFVLGQAATTSGVTAFANATILPGVYNSTASIGLSGTITLNGNGQTNPVFIFQMGSTLITANSSQILLTNGATAANVYWQVGSSATLGLSSRLVGNLLVTTDITVGNGAIVDGRALAKNGAMTLDTNTITAIPEPATTALLIAGFFGLVVIIRRLGRPSENRGTLV